MIDFCYISKLQLLVTGLFEPKSSHTKELQRSCEGFEVNRCYDRRISFIT